MPLVPFFHLHHFYKRTSHTSLEVPVGQKKELLIPPIWGCCGPTGGSIFTPGQKNHPAFFEGRWYTGKMARQIWAEWAVCLSSYLWKGWMVFLPRGKNWTSSRSTTTPDRWYQKFFFFGQLTLPMMCDLCNWLKSDIRCPIHHYTLSLFYKQNIWDLGRQVKSKMLQYCL